MRTKVTVYLGCNKYLASEFT